MTERKEVFWALFFLSRVSYVGIRRQEKRRRGGKAEAAESIGLDAHFKANILPLSHRPSPCFFETVYFCLAIGYL